MIKQTVYVVFAFLLLQSCMKEEPLWELDKSALAVQTYDVSMGENYQDVVFFSLSTRTHETRFLNDWHLKIVAKDSFPSIRLNGGLDIKVATDPGGQFTKDINLGNTSWQFDKIGDHPDSTAIGHWYNNSSPKKPSTVFILSLGEVAPKSIQIRFTLIDANHYLIETSEDGNANIDSIATTQSTFENYTYINLLSKKPVAFEPKKWDLCFTRYKHVFHHFNPPVPYLVSGVLSNSHSCKGTTSKVSFDSTNLAICLASSLTKQEDFIGHDWKYYDLNANQFKIRDKCFILKCTNGIFYKIKFIDFYDSKGRKGSPKFLITQL